MSNGNWRQETRHIALTLVALVGGMMALTGLFALGQYQSDYVSRQQEASRDPTEKADAKCYSVAGFSAVCVEGDSSAQADAERSEEDLRAQQDMAEWAKWITIFTALQIVVGAGGIYYVRKTLVETRFIGERELRAYVSLIPDFSHSFDTENAIQIAVKVQNDGATPARNLRFFSRVVLIKNFQGTVKPPGDEVDLTEIYPDPTGGPSLARGQFFYHHRTADRSFTAAEIEDIRNRASAVAILIKATYEDIFEKCHVEKIGAIVVADQDTLTKLSSLYQPSDLKITFPLLPGYGEST